MTGIRRRLRSRLVAETIEENETKPSESKLPIELIESIISYLSLQDNIRASAVCKLWRAAAISVRRANKSPWLMLSPTMGCTYEFFDPSQRKTYRLELPELHGCRIRYARDGWLLFYRETSEKLFFFSPYTREVIDLPRLGNLRFQMVAFSSAPTCSSCLVFTVKHVSQAVVAVSTYRPGADQWKTVNYPQCSPFESSFWNKLAFCNGLFYSLSFAGWLGTFDPEKGTWSVDSVPQPKRRDYLDGRFLAEHNNDLFIVYTCPTANPVVYKLDREKSAWMEIKTLSGMTLFTNFLCSTARADIIGKMGNHIYFSMVRYIRGKPCCVSYSLDKCEYYPWKEDDCGGPDPFKSFWVEPPQDLSIFRKKRGRV